MSRHSGHYALGVARNFSSESLMNKAMHFAHSIVLAALLTFTQVGIALCAEIKVLSAVAMKAALEDLAGEFERSAGHKITISYATAGELRNRIQGGEFGDMTILPRPAFESLLAQGKIVADSPVIFARSSVGVSVRVGAPKPDISSVDAVKRSLLAAKSIVYTDPARGGASGVHFVRVLERLGIIDEMKPKTKFTVVPGPGPAEVVAKGGAELAVSQAIDLLGVAGAEYVGPLPPELQNTSDFVFLAGVLASAKESEAAKNFIQYLRASDAARVIKARGLIPGD
jgi:molybdate transport system substrate-binding protein